MRGVSAKILQFVPSAAVQPGSDVLEGVEAEVLVFSSPHQGRNPVRRSSSESSFHTDIPIQNKSAAVEFNPSAQSMTKRSILTFPKHVQVSKDESTCELLQNEQQVGSSSVDFNFQDLSYHRNEVYVINLLYDKEQAVQHFANKISYYAQVDYPLIRSEILRRHDHLMGSLLPHVRTVFYDMHGDYFSELSKQKINLSHLRAFLHLMKISPHQAIKRHIWTMVPRLYLWANWFSKDDPQYAADLQRMLCEEFWYYLKG